MMGVPIDGPTSLFCDNKAVVTNTTAPEPMLKKKHNDNITGRVQYKPLKMYLLRKKMAVPT
jgi:hypothetical protein